MNPVFFSKKIPSVKNILSSSYLNIKPAVVLASDRLKFYKGGRLQKKTPNSKEKSLSSQFKQALVICDKRFQSSALLKSWRKNKQFKFYYIKSGEQTKSLECLPQHIQKINSLISDFDKSSLLFIGLGGGSVIDLTGFLASIYKRGLPVVFIPSTWLSALDSAHGGKNALNFKAVKNLLGTYHFPKAVFIVEVLLKQNPKALEQQAYGELLKIAFIKGGSFYKKIKQSVLGEFKNNIFQEDLKSFSYFQTNHQIAYSYKSLKEKNSNLTGFLFNNSDCIEDKKYKSSKKFGVNSTFSIQPFLKTAIETKIEIVKKDPFETKAERKKLNLGHTVGHILETVESLPHGLAVLHGLLFSLNWSYHKGFLSKKDYEEMKRLILLNSINLNFFGDFLFDKKGDSRRVVKQTKQETESLKRIAIKIPLKQFKSYLRQDKKHKAGFKIDFIFIKKPGQVFVQSVSEKDLIQEARRQALL